MLKDINIKINQIKEQVAEKKVLEEKLNNLEKEFSMYECELRNLEEILNKELHDVEKLKKISLSSIICTIMRNKEKKIEKEEKEYLIAKLKYDNCSSRITSLKNSKLRIEDRLSSLEDCEKRYAELLDTKLSLINIYGDTNQKNRILSMEKELDSYFKELKEVEESIGSGNTLYEEISYTKEILQSAKNWGTIDLFGGDFISSMAKHEKVDQAQNQFIRISNLLSNFNKELKDINIDSLNFSTTMKTFDIFFDNIFTDISVNSQISNSYDDICKLQRDVDMILKKLKDSKESLYEIIDDKKNEYDKFINSL
ncbi:hypothetical protein [Terrisporobacter mayombei]|uniref:Uncharacterized protein n=1 Tax=Terrisporobacter mayombei TaxID=1541 RepID=A0ABY9Q743_9FIRM|nr:hypothetical protein [Terrisporobacter mayombei]MCC3868815.1 hypothetical protein [Terrisporobacter mayombei]WMT83055.1 hypothetical protein TEMA_35530 [Terrisporobacter mayombei]